MANDVELTTGQDPRLEMASRRRRNRLICVALAVVVIIVAIGFFIKGSEFPSEKRMAQMMADVYTADALLQDYVPKGADDKMVEQIYHSVLGRYGLTKSDYDKAIAHYSQDPRELASLYERCVVILQAREEKFRLLVEKRDSTQKAIEQKNDSLRTHLATWSKPIKMPFMAGDSMRQHIKSFNEIGSEKLELVVDVDSIMGGAISFHEKYTFGKDNRFLQGRIRLSVMYADSSFDNITTDLSIGSAILQKDAEVSLELRASEPVVKAYVNILEGENLSNAVVTLRDLKLYHMPYVLSDNFDYATDIPSLFAY